MKSSVSAQQGFTLLELMTALAVMAVLLALGVPSFTEIVRNNRITAQANEFVSAINYARSEAVKRSNPVTLCASADGATCSGSTDWSAGWIAFPDDNANGVLDNAETVLQQWSGMTGGLTLNASVRSFIQYGATGMSGGAETFSLQKPGCTGDKARRVAVSTTGRISSTKVACT